MQNLNRLTLNNLRRFVNHRAGRVLAVTCFPVLSAQCPVGGSRVALLLDLMPIDQVLRGQVRVHRLDDGFRGVKADRRLFAVRGKREYLGTSITEHEFVQGDDGRNRGLS